MFNISAISDSTFAWYKPYLHHRLWRWHFLLASLPVNSNWVKEQPPISEDRCQIPGETLTLPSIRDLMLKTTKTTLLSVSQSAVTDADIPPDWIKTLTLKRRPCTYLPVAMASPGGANTNTLTADCSGAEHRVWWWLVANQYLTTRGT